MQDHDAPPFNPLPPVIVALAVVIGGIELLFLLADRGILGGAEAIGWRLGAVEGYAFSDVLFDFMRERGTYPVEELVRIVSYPFIQGGFTGAIFAVVLLLALGKMVAEVFAAWAVLVVFFGSAIAGALVWSLVQSSQAWLVGAFPPVYGLIGAYTFLLWVNFGAMGENQLRAFQLIAFLMGLQLLFGLLFTVGNAWIAELTAFVVGFLLSFVVSPGGWSRVKARMRQR